MTHAAHINKKALNGDVISLFDGHSCGQIALIEQGISFGTYYASEIDKFAIAQTQLNFPNTIQLGNVGGWKEWDIDWSRISLILAGSPCQGFSFNGKQLAFDDPRSRLFFVFVDILNHCRKYNPKVKFLLENVNMKQRHLGIISQYCGLFPARINSARVSAQNRDRFYWTNIRTKQIGLFGEIHSDIPQPEDRGVIFKDIMELNVPEKYYLSEKAIAALIKHAQNCKSKGYGFSTVLYGENSKVGALKVGGAGKDDLVIVHNVMPRSSKNGNGGTGHLARSDGKTYCLATGEVNAVEYAGRIRRLTPLERSRLQTIPEWYKWECSDAQVSNMTGNGWTVEVIKHILSFIQ